jgi:hypothetical protein
MLNLPLSVSHAGHTVPELLAGSRTTRSEELGEGIISPTLTSIFTLGLGRFFMSAGGDSNVDHCGCHVRSDRFRRLVESQQRIDARVVDGCDRILRNNRGIHMVVAEDECSSEQDDGGSSKGRGKTLASCS